MSEIANLETQEIQNEEVSSTAPESFSIDNASMEELNALADILSKAESEPVSSNNQIEQPAEAPSEEVVNQDNSQEEPAGEESLSVEEEGDQPRVSDRVRLSSLSNDDKHLVTTAVQLVKSGFAKNITDALAQLTQDNFPQNEPQEPAAQQEQAKPVATTSDRIAELETQLQAAKDDFDTAREAKITIEILKAISDLQKQEDREEQQKEEAAKAAKIAENQAKQAIYSESVAKANAAFPDGANPNTPFFKEVQKTVEEFHKTKPWILEDPEYPNLIAGYVAMKLGVSPANAHTQAPRTQQSQSPRVPSRPATTPMVGGNATTAMNRASVDSMISSLTPEQIDAVFRSAFN